MYLSSTYFCSWSQLKVKSRNTVNAIVSTMSLFLSFFFSFFLWGEGLQLGSSLLGVPLQHNLTYWRLLLTPQSGHPQEDWCTRIYHRTPSLLCLWMRRNSPSASRTGDGWSWDRLGDSSQLACPLLQPVVNRQVDRMGRRRWNSRRADHGAETLHVWLKHCKYDSNIVLLAQTLYVWLKHCTYGSNLLCVYDSNNLRMAQALYVSLRYTYGWNLGVSEAVNAE